MSIALGSYIARVNQPGRKAGQICSASAGLISRSRDAQWRPCKLRAEQLKSATEWLERYRRFWDQSFDRLDEYLKSMQEKEKSRGPKK